MPKHKEIPVPVFPEGEYVIENRASGAWMQATPRQIYPAGGRVEQWEKLGSSWQRWFLMPNNDGSYHIINRSTGNVLDASGPEVNHAVWIVTKEKTGASNQAWIFEALDLGFYKISNKGLSGKCLGVDLTKIVENGAGVVVVDYYAFTNMQWQIIPVKSL